MKYLFLTLFVFSIAIRSGMAQNTSIETALFELPDVIFQEITNGGNFEKTYELRIKQPLDHSNPGKGYFYQRAFLSHKDFDQPTVMYISGYSQRGVYETEVTQLLNANQISIEHRFFGESLPDTMDYNYLTLEQATADLHYINQLFRRIYSGKWLSTGISKGGATTVFYKYFYPGDVDAGIPYVAPINREFEEKRLTTFLDTIGSDACRAKILAFQKRMFKHRDEVIPLLKMYAKGAQLKFAYLSFEEAFEYSVLEYPFAFWQYGASCDEIPSKNSSMAEAAEYLMKISDIRLFSDNDIDYYLPHYYQSASQMGYYGYDTDNFKKDLKALPLQPHPHAAIVPDRVPVKFDGSLLTKVNKWVETDGNQLMYLYGAIDTWTAAGVPPSEKVDAVWFFMKGKDHATARYSQMTPDEMAKFITTLERWLDIKIENTEIK
ncbi:S28 family serine protease [Prolixibacteraceae bacterium Z1-6]|uniref:S28 family serine protease n=1 Tax=Draconibacterium aestuarii TaxID=2998507 RepID=A0A9X3F9V3_9BACT|nr:S28 family serine protease [Prolixibacteraceae bacterium Z1-6]